MLNRKLYSSDVDILHGCRLCLSLSFKLKLFLEGQMKII